MDGLQIAAIITAVGGVIGVLIAALRFKREDTGQLVQQQATILTGMRDLNVELRASHDQLTAIIDHLKVEMATKEELLQESRAALKRALDKLAELTKVANGGNDV